jgi:excisionase family DNA binding protein
MARAKTGAVPPLDPNLKWLLVPEAAQYLRVSPQTIHTLIHSGRLKAVRGFGQGFRIDRADLDNLLLREKKIIAPYRRGSHPWVTERWAQERNRKQKTTA